MLENTRKYREKCSPAGGQDQGLPGEEGGISPQLPFACGQPGSASNDSASSYRVPGLSEPISHLCVGIIMVPALGGCEDPSGNESATGPKGQEHRRHQYDHCCWILLVTPLGPAAGSPGRARL